LAIDARPLACWLRSRDIDRCKRLAADRLDVDRFDGFQRGADRRLDLFGILTRSGACCRLWASTSPSPSDLGPRLGQSLRARRPVDLASSAIASRFRAGSLAVDVVRASSAGLGDRLADSCFSSGVRSLPALGLAVDVDRSLSHRSMEGSLVRRVQARRGWRGSGRSAPRARPASKLGRLALGRRAAAARAVDIFDRPRRGQRQGHRDRGEDHQLRRPCAGRRGVAKHGLQPPVQGVASIERAANSSARPEAALAIARP
jgi:hypothetical protein